MVYLSTCRRKYQAVWGWESKFSGFICKLEWYEPIEVLEPQDHLRQEFYHLLDAICHKDWGTKMRVYWDMLQAYNSLEKHFR